MTADQKTEVQKSKYLQEADITTNDIPQAERDFSALLDELRNEIREIEREIEPPIEDNPSAAAIDDHIREIEAYIQSRESDQSEHVLKRNDLLKAAVRLHSGDT